MIAPCQPSADDVSSLPRRYLSGNAVSAQLSLHALTKRSSGSTPNDPADTPLAANADMTTAPASPERGDSGGSSGGSSQDDTSAAAAATYRANPGDDAKRRAWDERMRRIRDGTADRRDREALKRTRTAAKAHFAAWSAAEQAAFDAGNMPYDEYRALSSRHHARFLEQQRAAGALPRRRGGTRAERFAAGTATAADYAARSRDLEARRDAYQKLKRKATGGKGGGGGGGGNTDNAGGGAKDGESGRKGRAKSGEKEVRKGKGGRVTREEKKRWEKLMARRRVRYAQQVADETPQQREARLAYLKEYNKNRRNRERREKWAAEDAALELQQEQQQQQRAEADGGATAEGLAAATESGDDGDKQLADPSAGEAAMMQPPAARGKGSRKRRSGSGRSREPGQSSAETAQNPPADKPPPPSSSSSAFSASLTPARQMLAWLAPRVQSTATDLRARSGAVAGSLGRGLRATGIDAVSSAFSRMAAVDRATRSEKQTLPRLQVMPFFTNPAGRGFQGIIR